MLRRATGVLFAITVTVMAFATPAMAGSWTSSFSEWTIGSKSREWSDSDKPANTTVIGIRQCTYGGYDSRQQWITFRLHRNDTWTPDEHYEPRGVDCWSTSAVHTGVWNYKGEGKFYWTIEAICGQRGLVYASTPYVHMAY